jgi:hypothetical protein
MVSGAVARGGLCGSLRPSASNHVAPSADTSEKINKCPSCTKNSLVDAQSGQRVDSPPDL